MSPFHDSFNVPVKDAPAWGLRVELTLDVVDPETTRGGILLYVTSGPVRVRRGEKPVPAMVLSEVLREVDRLMTECGA